MTKQLTARFKYAGDQQWTLDVFEGGAYHDGARANNPYALGAWLAARYPDATVETFPYEIEVK